MNLTHRAQHMYGDFVVKDMFWAKPWPVDSSQLPGQAGKAKVAGKHRLS